MIEHLAGTILYRDEDHVVLDVGGVGYGVSVPLRTAQTLGEIGAETRLWIVTHVAEDALDLYGFTSRSEREVFKVFLGVSGVGPRLALAILSHFTVESLVQTVMAGDAAALKSVPGIGLKKAEKLLLEFKGRVKRLTAGIEPDRIAALTDGMDPASLASEAAGDAAAALETLGVAPAAAQRAIAKALEIQGSDADTESLVREGLKHRR